MTLKTVKWVGLKETGEFVVCNTHLKFVTFISRYTNYKTISHRVTNGSE